MDKSEGIYSLMQTKPIINRIIKELAVDMDKFLDELAANERPLEGEIQRV
jgi:hypothetical protein